MEEIFNQLSLTDRTELMERLQIESALDSAQLLNNVLTRYTHETLRLRIQQLSANERESLQLLATVLTEEENGLFLQEAVRMLSPLYQQEGAAYAVIEQLRMKGLLFLFAQGWSEVVIAPKEVQQYSFAQALRKWRERYQTSTEAESTPADRIQVVENYGLSLYHDVLTLVATFARDVIQITQKGHVYKREMKRMLARLRTQECRFPDTFGEAVPRNFYFLESFLKYHRIVSFENEAIVNKRAIYTLLQTSYMGWTKLLHSFFMRRVYIGRNFPRAFLTELFFGIDDDGWIEGDQLLEQFQQQLSRWGLVITRTEFDKMCYHPLTLLGLIEWGEDAAGQSYWRWTKRGQQYNGRHIKQEALGEALYVQPNLEIIVPEHVLPAIRWSVESFAELQQADTAFVYKFTRARLRQALEAGWTVSKIAAFLHQYSKIPVADNVVPTLEGWLGHYGKAMLWDVMVLKLEDERLAAMVKRDRGYARWVVASFAEDTFVIRRQEENQVRAWLEDLGMTVPLHVRVADSENVAGESTPLNQRPWANEEKKRRRDAVLLHNLTALSPVPAAYLEKSIVAQGKRIGRESFADDEYSL